MFMYHPNVKDIGTGNRYSKGWLGIKTPSSWEVAKLIVKYPASNCLWAGGVRKKVNFRIAEWLGLDFDEGLTIDDAIEKFGKYIHVIGTTKSHRKKKNGIACDRFRVFLKFNRRCDSTDDYEFICRQWVKEYNADRACVDAARFFWPCKEIVSSEYMGKCVEVLNSQEYMRKKQEKDRQRIEKMKRMYPDKAIPAYIQNRLKFGCKDRNIACYGIGADLAKLSFSDDEIISLVQNSAIISDGFSLKEAVSATRSGIKKARQT